MDEEDIHAVSAKKYEHPFKLLDFHNECGIHHINAEYNKQGNEALTYWNK